MRLLFKDQDARGANGNFRQIFEEFRGRGYQGNYFVGTHINPNLVLSCSAIVFFLSPPHLIRNDSHDIEVAASQGKRIALYDPTGARYNKKPVLKHAESVSLVLLEKPCADFGLVLTSYPNATICWNAIPSVMASALSELE